MQGAKWLYKDDLNTLYKFIIRVFELKNKKVYISEEQASRLYGQIMQASRKDHEVRHLLLNKGNKKQDGVNVLDTVKFSYVPFATNIVSKSTDC